MSGLNSGKLEKYTTYKCQKKENIIHIYENIIIKYRRQT
jgi:hypothetical protein